MLVVHEVMAEKLFRISNKENGIIVLYLQYILKSNHFENTLNKMKKPFEESGELLVLNGKLIINSLEC